MENEKILKFKNIVDETSIMCNKFVNCDVRRTKKINVYSQYIHYDKGLRLEELKNKFEDTLKKFVEKYNCIEILEFYNKNNPF